MLTKFDVKVMEINSDMLALGHDIIKANQEILKGLESGDFGGYKNARSLLDDVALRADAIDSKVVTTLALFAPEARDLKNIISYLKVTNEYIRAASNTRSFLKNFPSKIDGDINVESIMPNTILLQKATLNALGFAVAIIEEKDKSIMKDLCVKANVEEAKNDDIYTMIEKSLFVETMNAQELSKEYFETLSLVRKIEKIGDRAAAIANTLYDGRAH